MRAILISKLGRRRVCHSPKMLIQNIYSFHLVHSCYKPPGPRPDLGNFLIRRYSVTEIFRSGINLKPSRNKNRHLDVSFERPCLFYWFPNITRIFMSPWWFAISIYKTIVSSSTPTSSTQLPVSTSTKSHAVSVSCCRLSFVCQFHRTALKLPEFHINDSTESFLRNLIAYEQFNMTYVPRTITSYVYLMHMIINTKEHEEMLETSGVLRNYLVSTEAAADLFNRLCKNVASGDKFYFSEEWKQLDAYCNLKWPVLLGSLRVTYFSNPWTSISVFAALVLFALTIIQTVGTVVQTW